MSYVGDLSELLSLFGESLQRKSGSTSVGWQTIAEHCQRVFENKEVRGGFSVDYARHLYKKYLKLQKKEAELLGDAERVNELDKEIKKQGTGVLALIKVLILLVVVAAIVYGLYQYFGVEH